MTISINPAFRDLIPPLGPEELAQLETNILVDGCRDPLVLWNGTLVDGHNRYTICSRRNIPFKTVEKEFTDEDAAKIWIIQNQFGRRNLAPFTRAELALKLEPMMAAKAKENKGKRNDLVQNSDRSSKRSGLELAKVAGLSHDTIAKAKLINDHADEDTKKKLRENKVSIHRVAKEIKQKVAADKRQEARSKSSSAVVDEIIVGDFSTRGEVIKDGSLSLIFTDPPYDRNSIPLFESLGEFAAKKLEDGGSLICYVGHVQIIPALNALSRHLRYWWTCACIHAGNSTVMREYGIRAKWKAMLWFVKRTRADVETLVGDVVSGGQEKSHHDWQQSETEAGYWIEMLCPKDGVVCDPFLGGGTTAAAAKALKRKWVGFEIDPDTAKIASGRIAK